MFVQNHSSAAAALALMAAFFMASIGGIILAAALKMRKLKAYRLCRMGSILAMLPLSPAFLIGLPLGIWALCVLRRPDVKAAFAENDGGPFAAPQG